MWIVKTGSLQHLTVYSFLLQKASVTQRALSNTLQHTGTHCNTLQHTATHCNTLQHTATHCNTLQHSDTTHSCTPQLIHVRYTRRYVVAHTHSQVWQDPFMYATTLTLIRHGAHTLTSWSKQNLPRGGFLFTMFPDQEPCVRDFMTRCDRRILSWNLWHMALDQGT